MRRFTILPNKIPLFFFQGLGFFLCHVIIIGVGSFIFFFTNNTLLVYLIKCTVPPPVVYKWTFCIN